MNVPNLRRTLLAGLGWAPLLLLAGCANTPRWGEWSKHPTDKQIAAVLARTAGAIAIQPAPAARPATLLAAASH